MTGFVPVQGTWSWRDDPRSVARRLAGPIAPPLWWQRGSSVMQELEKHDLAIWNPSNPYIWSTDLDGLFVPEFVWRFLGGKLRQWRTAGWNLMQYAERIPFEHRNFLTYSHGWQPMLFALYYGLEARNIVAVGPPLRDDVLEVVTGSTLMYDQITIITEYGAGDIIRDLGQLFGGNRTADDLVMDGVLMLEIEGIGHGSILEDPQYVQMWTDRGWWHLLKGDFNVHNIT